MKPPAQQQLLELIERPPRIQPLLPEAVNDIPAPPTIETHSQPLLQLMLPLVTVVGYVLMSFSGASRNILFVLPMSFAMLFSFYIAYSAYKTEQKRQKMLRQQYQHQLENLRLAMNRWHHNQRQFYDYNYPKTDSVLQFTHPDYHSRLGIRLWERRWDDADFGVLRLGLGDIPSRVVYELSNANADSSDPILLGLAQQLELDSQVVTHAPILWHLRPSADPDDPKAPRARFSVGIVGKTSSAVRDVAMACLVQYVGFHSPFDATLFVIGSSSVEDDWDWASWLPHTNSKIRDYKGDRMVFVDIPPNTATTDLSNQKDAPITKFWDGLKKELDARRARLADKDTRARAPFLLVVVDMLTADNQPIPPWLLEIPSIDSASIILAEGDKLGAAILFLTSEAQKIPSDCQTVIEVAKTGVNTTFYYSEIGNNSARYIGVAEVTNQDKATPFAEQLQNAYVRRGYGAELESKVSLLDLYDAKTLDDIRILDNWRAIERKNPDWLRVKLGLEGGRKTFSLYLQQDHDGVHGMIAGTTGSGKSELLLTLIAGLALTYPPDILNFLLVDYKGGTAFEPFIGLPHAVDILTNLEGNVVERMFIALRAELEQRQNLLKSFGDSHIVAYHLAQREKDDQRPPLPFLFIVIDEFAEMVTKNNEYKAHFDSITRLGRALGVSLLLATQRPTGAVTDQMRSNIKYRICLRVETSDDSRELLGLSDAVFLPSNIPGRAYMQAGNISPKLVQMAYTGGDYIPQQSDELPDIIHVKAVTSSPIGRTTTDLPDDSATPPKPKKVIHELVARIIQVAKDAKYKRQYKPWPDPLPPILPLNLPLDNHYIHPSEAHITARRNADQMVINHAINYWVAYQAHEALTKKEIRQWHSGYAISDWEKTALRADIGLVDVPHKGEQRLLTLDLNRGPLILFGASGWGKTTFLYTLLVSLATTHTPNELHIYAIGRKNLDVIKALPHVARPIEIPEQTRIERLLRVISNQIEERKLKLARYSSLAAYNSQHRDQLLPAILIVLDNYADFKDSYDLLQDQLLSVVRAGRAMGIYFVFTADQLSALPSGLLNLFTQRLTLKLADTSTYSDIVGRGAISLTETSGRGFITLPERNPRDRMPLEFQIGLPCVVTDKDGQLVEWSKLNSIFNLDTATDNLYAIIEKLSLQNQTAQNPLTLRDFNAVFTQICENMNTLWQDRAQPAPIEPLETDLTLAQIQALAPNTVSIGLRDSDRKPLTLSFSKRESHLLVIGTPLSGKTTTLHSLILALAGQYPPEKIALILIDPQEDMFNYGGRYSLAQLPHVLQTVSNERDLDELLLRLKTEYDPQTQRTLIALDPTAFSTPTPPQRELFIFIDHYDNRKDLDSSSLGDKLKELADWAGQYRKIRLHIILAASLETYTREKDTLMRKVEGLRHTLTLQITDLGMFGTRLPAHSIGKSEFPLGRGFLIKGEHAELVQIARPYVAQGPDSEAQMIAELDSQVQALMAHYQTRAEWYFVGKLSMLESVSPSTPPITGTNAPTETIDIPDSALDVIKQLDKEGNKG